jgi:DNA-directed RNA polymerase specialized sigma24 family protein
MDHKAGEDAPPSTDLAGWRRAVGDGCFRAFSMESIVAAIQDLRPTTDKAVMNPLVLHVSDTIMRMLRGVIGRNHRNDGEDMVTRAHAKLVAAMFSPNSADGKGLRVAFRFRVEKRAADAIRAETKIEKRELEAEAHDDAKDEPAATAIDPWQEVNEQMDVERVLALVTNDQKRLAFRLYMEDVPIESTKKASIVKALGVSRKTAEKWIEEVRALLAAKLGEKT